jgi:hypothetical protein
MIVPERSERYCQNMIEGVHPGLFGSFTACFKRFFKVDAGTKPVL